jgi:hypothetical protein
LKCEALATGADHRWRTDFGGVRTMNSVYNPNQKN